VAPLWLTFGSRGKCKRAAVQSQAPLSRCGQQVRVIRSNWRKQQLAATGNLSFSAQKLPMRMSAFIWSPKAAWALRSESRSSTTTKAIATPNRVTVHPGEVPVEGFGDHPELDNEVAGEVLGLDLAALLPPEAEQGSLVVDLTALTAYI
jgi:hypothetical protein